ncbi:TrmB family transcriptional regulator [Peribacillus sp. B-H-3]|uniref:TrmB family transcriptional regulator n=1 Tax=Peribacillus sp. B-H-3 TaxID=3400420 RepID=UPI003B02003F
MLQKFGYSQYESQVYETLLSSQESMDATAIVTHSQVPKAKVYEVLNRMIDKGLIMNTVSEKKKLYYAVPLEAVIKKLTYEFEQSVESLKQKKIQRSYTDDRVWSLKARSTIFAQIETMLQQAHTSILMSSWSENLVPYLPILEQKEREGLEVEILTIGNIETSLSRVHTLVPLDEHERLEKSHLLVIDQQDAVFAGIEHDQWKAIKTMSQPFVKFFTDFFYHDAALTTITERFHDQLVHDEVTKKLLTRLRY